MSETPLISVLIAAHNEARFIEASVRSVLTQTIAGIEVIVVDDASSDGTTAIVDRIGDLRIRMIRNPANLGLAASLNRGLAQCRGKYVARLDADDISLPNRLEAQFNYLEGHPDVVILGSYAQSISEDGHRRDILRRPRFDCQIRWLALLANPFVHPSVMLRMETLQKNSLQYREDLRIGQDYALWTLLLGKGAGANLPRSLIQYRLREGLSSKNREGQLLNNFVISHQVLREWLPEAALSFDEARELGTLVYFRDVLSPELRSRWDHFAEIYLKLFWLFEKKFGASQQLKCHFIEQCLVLSSIYPGSRRLLDYAWQNSRKTLPFLIRYQISVLKGRSRRLK